MKLFLLGVYSGMTKALAILAIAILPSLSFTQDAPPKIADHPLFTSMLDGTWTETGEVLLDGQAVKSENKSTCKLVLNGTWFQQDGTGTFGEKKIEWRWMFRLVKAKDGRTLIQARFIDDSGQVSDFIGAFNNDETGVRLERQINDTTKQIIVVSHNKENTERKIQSAIVTSDGKQTVIYNATGTKG